MTVDNKHPLQIGFSCCQESRPGKSTSSTHCYDRENPTAAWEEPTIHPSSCRNSSTSSTMTATRGEQGTKRHRRKGARVRSLCIPAGFVPCFLLPFILLLGSTYGLLVQQPHRKIRGPPSLRRYYYTTSSPPLWTRTATTAMMGSISHTTLKFGRRLAAANVSLNSSSRSESDKVGSNGKDSGSSNDTVTRLQREAARMRLEAEKMDWELTKQKLQTMQDNVEKLRVKQTRGLTDPAKLSEALGTMERQVEQLRQKLGKKDDDDPSVEAVPKKNDATKGTAINKSASQSPSRSSSMPTSSSGSYALKESSREVASLEVALEVSTEPAQTSTVVLEKPVVKPSTSPTDDDEDGWSVFDPEDLALYLPVANAIEARLTNNSTLDEKLEAFRTAPELQTHFQKQITQLIVEPLQNMQRLEELQRAYLKSTSVREKDHLKNQIDRLSQSLEKETGRFQYSESVYRNVPALREDQIEERIATVNDLPGVLQTLYKRRYQLPSNSTDIRLAILLDHYEQQMQLIDQVKMLGPVGPKLRAEVVQAVESLPSEVRIHMARRMQLNTNDTDALVEELVKEEKETKIFSNKLDFSPLSKVVMEAIEMSEVPAEYNDIAFVDRSRYVNEFYPSIARMEGLHPNETVIQQFANEILNKRSFMVTSKPERVIGGWYIRGRNLIDEGDGGSGVRLMQELQRRVGDATLQYFYIPDPSPLSDEEVELEYRNDPLLVVTANEPRKFYNYADPWIKASVSALSLFFVVTFACGVCFLEPAMLDRWNAELEQTNSGAGAVDLSWFTDLVMQLLYSFGAIQIAHELGHRVVAWRDKFDVGLPTPVPSLQIGCMGTITPLKSPPPNLKSMFDFGVAGPVFGMITSITFLVSGLTITAGLDFTQTSSLPVLPSDLLLTSALGGGLIESFLGRGALIQGESQGYLPLHPYAIAGFLGILTNALALLPLGNTDGGRIALAMFGRRGAYIVKVFTTAILCLAGLVGFDKAGILLTHVLFAVIWQRELEAPARNEVEELDFLRGASGIGMAVLVALALLPIR